MPVPACSRVRPVPAPRPEWSTALFVVVFRRGTRAGRPAVGSPRPSGERRWRPATPYQGHRRAALLLRGASMRRPHRPRTGAPVTLPDLAPPAFPLAATDCLVVANPAAAT